MREKIIVIVLSVVILSSISFAYSTGDYNQSNFDNGTYNNTHYNTTYNYVIQNYSYENGSFTSRVFDAGYNVTWSNISWNIIPNVTPYAMWHMNETSGNTVYDSSGNGINGNRTNMEDSDWVAGKINNSLQFDGVNEYVFEGHVSGERL